MQRDGKIRFGPYDMNNMSESEPDAFDTELAEMLTLETLAAGMPRPQPLDALRAFLNEAVSRQLITFADDVFETAEERDETLVAIAKVVEEELEYTPLIQANDVVTVHGVGIVSLLGVVVSETGAEVALDEIEVGDGVHIEGLFTDILVGVPQEEHERVEALEEAGEELSLSLTTVNIYLGLSQTVLHSLGYETEQLGESMMALIDVNDKGLKLERIVSPEDEVHQP